MDKEKIIENLIHAEKNKIQINFFKENEKLAKSESYQLQKNLVDEKKRIFNSDLAGYKISMTSSDTQAIANTHEPAYGRILDYNIQTNTNEVKIDDLLEPLLEPELVFQLNEDLSSDVSYTEIIQKTSIQDRKSTRLNSSHVAISYAVFCLKKKKHKQIMNQITYNI